MEKVKKDKQGGDLGSKATAKSNKKLLKIFVWIIFVVSTLTFRFEKWS